MVATTSSASVGQLGVHRRRLPRAGARAAVRRSPVPGRPGHNCLLRTNRTRIFTSGGHDLTPWAQHTGNMSTAVPSNHARPIAWVQPAAEPAPGGRGRRHAPRARRRPRRLPPAARRPRSLRGRIVEVTPETAESATILVKPGRDWAGHVPGQYVRMGVDVDGVRLWRTYSLTHGPRADRCISITVKAIPGGVVSQPPRARGAGRRRWSSSSRPRASSCCRSRCRTSCCWSPRAPASPR